MKKAFNLLALVVLSLALGLGGKDVFARITGTQPTNPDAWCAGRDGAEVCVDSSGNVVPTTDNDATSGSSSLRWSTVNALDLTLGDDLSVTDDATVSDDLTVTGDSFKTMVATITVANSDTISVAGACGGILRLNPNNNNVTIAGFTTPAAANAGCIVYVVNAVGNGEIRIATSATFVGISNGGFLIGGNPAVNLGTNDAMIIGQMGATWVMLSSVVQNN